MKPLGPAGEHYWRVLRMARACDADLAAAVRRGSLDQREWADIVRRCRGCAWSEDCRRWLERAERRAAASEAPPAECQNRARLIGLGDAARKKARKKESD